MRPQPSAAVVMDVDGVVSPVHGRTDWRDDVVAGWAFGPVSVSPELCRRLDAITSRPDVVGVWLTDWDAQMRAGAEPFPGRSWCAIERPDIEPNDPSQAGPTWWKAPALFKWLDQHPTVTTIIWADDHLGRPGDARLNLDDVEHGAPTRASVLARSFKNRGIAAQLVVPETSVGLTRADVASIEAAVDAAQRTR